MQVINHLAELKAKIKTIRHFNAILAAVVTATLVWWAMTAFVFTEKDIGTATAAEQVQKLSENIRRFYQNRPDFWGLNTQTVIDKQIAPQAMLANGKLQSFFGAPVLVGNGSSGQMLMPGARSFDIALTNLNNQQCRELATFKFEQNFWLGVGEMKLNNGNKEVVFDWNNSSNMLPVKAETAKELCGANNIIMWHFN